MQILKKWLDDERGRAAGLARALGVSATFVWKMAHEDRPVPVEHAAAVERFTGGAVTRRDIRPQDWHLIWPELAAADSPPNPPAVLGNQARAAIKTVAQEVAHVGA